MAVVLGLSSAASAQGPTQVDSVKVSLWPEYDRPEVLVIYRVELPATTELPAPVDLLIPPDAPELTAAAFGTGTGGLLNAEYTRRDGEQADVVEVLAEGPLVQIEYYLPLPVAGAQRQFMFTWPGGLATSAFLYEVQQPTGAQDLQVDPAATAITPPDALGLIYHQVDLGAQTAQETPRISFSYSKDTSELSASAPPAGGLAQPEPAAAPSIDVRGALPWVLLVGGVGLLAAGLLYFFRGRSQEASSRQRHRSSRPRREDARVDASPVFCHNCGTQATAADRFCRQCGTALRT
jgi:hypothetical protein